MIKRTSWGSPSFIDGDDLVGDRCRTPGCSTVPKYGAIHCDACRDRIDADEFEAKCDAHVDRMAEAERDER